MPQEQLKKWRRYTDFGWERMTLEQVRELLELKEQNDADRLEQYGWAEALMRVQRSFQIEPQLLAVGIFLVNKLKDRMVVFGRVDEGVFCKGDAVRIDHKGSMIETSVLEAHLYDPDIPENDFDITLRANMGKHRLAENQVGWLILDYDGEIYPGDRVVK